MRLKSPSSEGKLVLSTDSFVLIPPFYTTRGFDISVGLNFFVNQNSFDYRLGNVGKGSRLPSVRDADLNEAAGAADTA